MTSQNDNFRLNLTLTENEVLQGMVEQAGFHHMEKQVSAFADELKAHMRSRLRPQGAEAPLPEPKVGRLMRHLIEWTNVMARLKEDLIVAYRQGLTVVSIGRSDFEALYALQAKDWSKNDGTPKGVAFSMAVESCRPGIQAAFGAARINLDRQTMPTQPRETPAALAKREPVTRSGSHALRP